jgi:hypothetical protein
MLDNLGFALKLAGGPYPAIYHNDQNLFPTQPDGADLQPILVLLDQPRKLEIISGIEFVRVEGYIHTEAALSKAQWMRFSWL